MRVALIVVSQKNVKRRKKGKKSKDAGFCAC